MKYWVSLILLCTLWLVSCSSAPPLAASPAAPTRTSPPAAAPTRTSAAPVPTSTPSPIPDSSAAEFELTSTAIVQAVVTAQQPREYETYTSPDGSWQASVLIYDCIQVDPGAEAGLNSLEQLRVLDTNSGEETVPDSQLLYCGGLGAFGLEGLFWSPNSRFFYYTNAREGVPDGCSGNWERPVLRMETGTFQVDALGSGPLSPDGTRLATWQGEELVLWDVNEGTEIGRFSPAILNTELGAGGPIVWSPDGQALVYIQSGSFCQPSTNSAVVRVDLQTLEQEILLESKSPLFTGARWEKANELTLFDEGQNSWTYNLDSRELEPLP